MNPFKKVESLIYQIESLVDILCDLGNEKDDFVNEIKSDLLTLKDGVDKSESAELLNLLDQGRLTDDELHKLIDMLDPCCQPHPYIVIVRAKKAVQEYDTLSSTESGEKTDDGSKSCLVERVFVACINASGESDFFVTDVEVAEEEYHLDRHADIAIARAKNEGYMAPFLCYSA